MQLVHVRGVGLLVQDLEDAAQPRFGELRELARGEGGGAVVEAAEAVGSALARAVASL